MTKQKTCLNKILTHYLIEMMDVLKYFITHIHAISLHLLSHRSYMYLQVPLGTMQRKHGWKVFRIGGQKRFCIFNIVVLCRQD